MPVATRHYCCIYQLILDAVHKEGPRVVFDPRNSLEMTVEMRWKRHLTQEDEEEKCDGLGCLKRLKRRQP